MRRQALAVVLASFMAAPAGLAHDELTLLPPGFEGMPEAFNPAFGYLSGCDVLFEDDRRVAHEGTEVSPPVEKLTPQRFGPDTSVYRWKAVYRHLEVPCQGVIEIAPTPRR